jgi:23S rRNA (guanosine2251-2'-O)-methyltransferase
MYDVDFSLPTALVLGSEEDGISKELMGLTDEFAGIPVAGNIDSLNVSVAAAVLTYEAVRQRRG